MTYYAAANGGSMGANGKPLVAFQSVAVRDFKANNGRKLEIKGIPGTMVVDDLCPDAKCKDFDFYVGNDVGQARRIPNWEAGNIPIEYRWLT
jgi:hypothetical protein